MAPSGRRRNPVAPSAPGSPSLGTSVPAVLVQNARSVADRVTQGDTPCYPDFLATRTKQTIGAPAGRHTFSSPRCSGCNAPVKFQLTPDDARDYCRAQRGGNGSRWGHRRFSDSISESPRSGPGFARGNVNEKLVYRDAWLGPGMRSGSRAGCRRLGRNQRNRDGSFRGRYRWSDD